MITQDYDKSVSKKQESGLKWLIIFLGKVCIPQTPKYKIWDLRSEGGGPILLQPRVHPQTRRGVNHKELEWWLQS